MKFSVVIPTRGDVDLTPIIASYDNIADEVLVWDNSKRENLAVYARYAMIAEARNELIMTQDDDVIVSDPRAIVDTWIRGANYSIEASPRAIPISEQVLSWEGRVPPAAREVVVCNMPEAHRSQPFYREHALVGYGAVFHRDAPKRAFQRYWDSLKVTVEFLPGAMPGRPTTLFERRCDVLFTALTPRVLVDVPIRNLPYYDAPNRSWKQKNHFSERKKMLELALRVRDA